MDLAAVERGARIAESLTLRPATATRSMTLLKSCLDDPFTVPPESTTVAKG
jgi:hypothetical protein